MNQPACEQIAATQLQANKYIHIETWGCQMNVADSERILAIMAKENFTLTDSPEKADLIVLNTCHIREKARHKVVSRLGVLKELKKNQPQLKIAVAGCVAQAEGRKLIEQAPSIDVLVGPGKLAELPELLRQRQTLGQPVWATGFPRPTKAKLAPAGELTCQQHVDAPPSLHGKNPISRFVTIQQGCDNFCTFCVVPFTRGREVSERPEVVVAKAKALIKCGAREITLLGQNVNSYGKDLPSESQTSEPFVDLLSQVARIDSLVRLRFTTSNPHDLSPALADLFSREPKLGSYYHLPVQSGSDRILAAMRRKVTAAEYLERVAWLRQAVPDMALSTDLIVGFPGETAEDFEQTLALVKKVGFSFVYAFKYSPRKGTAAQRFKEQVPEATKTARLAQLNALQDAISLQQQHAEIGCERRVLFTYESTKEAGIYYGRSEHFRLVRVAAKAPLNGQVRQVRITAANKTALVGELV